MRRLRSNLIIVFVSLFACINNYPHIEASTVNASAQDITAMSGQGSLNNVDVFRLDASGNLLISSYTSSGTNPAHTTFSNQGVFTSSGNWVHTNTAKTYWGLATVAQTTTTTSGVSQGDIFTAFLASGSASGSGMSIAAVEGSVLCSTTAQQGQGNAITVVVCPPINNLGSVIGVAASAASTGTVVNVFINGWVLAQTTGTVNPGDMLSTTALSTGVFVTSGSTAAAAIALGPGNANGGNTRVHLFK